MVNARTWSARASVGVPGRAWSKKKSNIFSASQREVPFILLNMRGGRIHTDKIRLRWGWEIIEEYLTKISRLIARLGRYLYFYVAVVVDFRNMSGPGPGLAVIVDFL